MSATILKSSLSEVVYEKPPQHTASATAKKRWRLVQTCLLELKNEIRQNDSNEGSPCKECVDPW